MRISVLNGPNLNLLGSREPEVYGTVRLDEIRELVRARAAERGADILWAQTNHEGEFVDFVQALAGSADGAIVNAAALTHTSLSVRDALLATTVPFVEVHLSNIFAREEARRKSLLADLAIGLVSGFGAHSYLLGLDALISYLEASDA